MSRRHLVFALGVLSALGVAAFLVAQGLAGIVGGTLAGGFDDGPPPKGMRASLADVPSARDKPSAQAILDRNPFDHSAHDLLAPVPEGSPCADVRTLIVAGAADPDLAIAAFDVGGKRLVRRRGGEVAGKTVFFVGADRVWLEKDGVLCEAKLGAPERTTAAPSGTSLAGLIPGDPRGPTDLERAVGSKIVKTSETEYQIDRSAVDRILEAQTELMKARVVPEKQGDSVVGMRVFGVKQGSVLSLLGIQNGDRLESINGFDVSNPEKMLELYARLRGGSDHLTVRLTRGAKTMDVDYSVR